MKANSLSSLHVDYWSRRMVDHFYGFNTNPRTNRIDEYERYNAWRRYIYDRQDRLYREQMYALTGALVFLLVLFAALA